ncbi:hypothetical protein R1flu_014815 [Riccia fluitans]|uniref:Uncharacterized protein n=1 Tax=Riccia fluitans TaxID=41844 RepID=A0ABD1YKJ3_9MARC
MATLAAVKVTLCGISKYILPYSLNNGSVSASCETAWLLSFFAFPFSFEDNPVRLRGRCHDRGAIGRVLHDEEKEQRTILEEGRLFVVEGRAQKD